MSRKNAARDRTEARPPDASTLAPSAESWATWAGSAFALTGPLLSALEALVADEASEPS